MLAAAVCLALFAPPVASGSAWPIDAFPDQWYGARVEKSVMHEGHPVSLLYSGEVRANAGKVPPDRSLNFQIWVRPQVEDSTITVTLTSFDADTNELRAKATSTPAPKGKWTLLKAETSSPTKTDNLLIEIWSENHTATELSEPRLTLGGTELASLEGDGLLHASSATATAGDGGKLVFPVPGPDDQHAPVSFWLTCDPPKALKGFTISRRSPENWICTVKVKPPKNGFAQVRWHELLLVRQKPLPKLPKVALSGEPASLATWLTSTPVVQSGNREIKRIADEILAKSNNDLGTFVSNVCDYVKDYTGNGQPFVALDALSAVGCGGSCTSHSNLAAAILRAEGVPARTVSHLPTWCYGEELYEHWLTEYWHPGVGWVPFDATMGVLHPQACTYAPLATSSIQDEKLTGHPGQTMWIMPGAAWMSGIQAEGNLMPVMNGTDYGDSNWCRPERRMTVAEPLFKAAIAAWPRSAQPMTSTKTRKAGLDGSPASLLRALQSG